jgi:hypothetical protein
MAAGLLDSDWAVAVVTAGGGHRRLGLRALQEEPARLSRRGRAEAVAGAGHATLLGVRFADHVVAAIEFVRDAAAMRAA